MFLVGQHLLDCASHLAIVQLSTGALQCRFNTQKGKHTMTRRFHTEFVEAFSFPFFEINFFRKLFGVFPPFGFYSVFPFPLVPAACLRHLNTRCLEAKDVLIASYKIPPIYFPLPCISYSSSYFQPLSALAPVGNQRPIFPTPVL